MYLNAGGTLSSDPPRLAESRTTYTFDPKHPVPTIGGNTSSNQGLITNGGYDQRPRDDTHAAPDRLPLSERRDVLVFRTSPLEADLEVTGTVQVKLWVGSTAPDTDFTAKLIDEIPPNPDYPLGFDLGLGDSIFAPALPRRARPSGLSAGPERRRTDRDHALPDSQCLQEGASHQGRHIEQQLSTVRRQPQHERPARRLPAHGLGRQYGLSRDGPSVAGDLAAYSRERRGAVTRLWSGSGVLDGYGDGVQNALIGVVLHKRDDCEMLELDLGRRRGELSRFGVVAHVGLEIAFYLGEVDGDVES